MNPGRLRSCGGLAHEVNHSLSRIAGAISIRGTSIADFVLDIFSQNGNIVLARGRPPCHYMRVISRRPLNELAKRYPEAKAELDAWFHEAEAARWANPAEVKEKYGSASILKGSRVVFNICGNKYRLVVKINYSYAVVYVRFAGTHQEYDRVNAEAI